MNYEFCLIKKFYSREEIKNAIEITARETKKGSNVEVSFNESC